jgi:hypothetical protein
MSTKGRFPLGDDRSPQQRVDDWIRSGRRGFPPPWEPPFARLNEREEEARREAELAARRAASPPPPTKPTLVTKDGAFVAVSEEFTVWLSPDDPQWKPDVPGWCFRKAKPPVEDYGKSLVRRIAERRRGHSDDKA